MKSKTAFKMRDNDAALIRLQNVLFAIGDAFLNHASNFKLYSSFCASHSKAQKVLLPSK